jgi:hypothetical protein
MTGCDQSATDGPNGCHAAGSSDLSRIRRKFPREQGSQPIKPAEGLQETHLPY